MSKVIDWNADGSCEVTEWDDTTGEGTLSIIDGNGVVQSSEPISGLPIVVEEDPVVLLQQQVADLTAIIEVLLGG